jgi:hypothetical protein
MRILCLVLVTCFSCLSCSVPPPEGAPQTPVKTAWSCERGYYKAGFKCVPVQLPAHAQVDEGGKGWTCQRGYYRAGRSCAPIQVPEHAQIDEEGRGWACMMGYYQSGRTCVQISVPEHGQIRVNP